jgi:thiamine biosynthesis lipoprotein
MFSSLFGRAFMRWLEKLAEEEPQEPCGDDYRPGPAPEVALAQPVPLGSAPSDQQDAVSDRQNAVSEWIFPRVQRAAMGSLFEIYLAGRERETLVGAAQEALEEIERLERQLSHYREDSDISRLNLHAPQQWVRLEPRLYHLLKRCAALHMETDGAFDITTDPLTRLWGFHRGEGRVPSEGEIRAALENVGMYRVLFEDEDHLVRFTAPQLSLNLGAIGKGYAVDAAVETLRFYNLSRAVVHGGQSTIYALGAPPDDDAWEFTLRDPRDHQTPVETVRLRDQAISTSGGYEQFFEVEGVRYSHILDPLTGYPAQGALSVSVIASSAADSDALSTAFFVLGAEGAQDYCRAHPEIRVIMMQEQADQTLKVIRIGCD